MLIGTNLEIKHFTVSYCVKS